MNLPMQPGQPQTTDSILSETPLSLRLSFLDNLLAFSDHGIVMAREVDGKLQISTVNDRLCELFDVTQEQLVNQPLSKWSAHLGKLVNMAETDSDFLSALETIPSQEEIDEFVILNEQGSTFRQRRTCAVDSDGKSFGILLLYRDITHSKHLEDQALHTQKMESVGTLAGGIAHDFNNILTAILGYGSALKEDLKDDPEASQKLEQVIRSAHRAADLTRNLLAFSRKNPHLPQILDFNALVRDTSAMLSFAMPDAVHMHIELGKDLPSVEADPAQMQQVITHLVINARDAIYGEGNIRVSTRIAKDPQARRDNVNAEYVVLDVEDDGIGIPKDNLSHIFEPFYSNKETGKGIGLGLAMVYGAIKQHFGYVEVESAPNMGSRFSLHIPASGAVISKKMTQQIVLPTPATQGATVLVIDDENDLREICKVGLSNLCKDVLLASDGSEGVTVYQEHKDTVDLVILDLTMPRMSGQECFEELLKINPNVKVIISSGYSQEMGADDLIEAGAIGFLSKPFTMKELTATVSDALNAIRD